MTEHGSSSTGVHQENLVDVSLILKERFSSALLLHLTETIGNPLALLFSKAHLSKAFCEAAHAAQGGLKHVDFRKWARTVDDTVVISVASKCAQLSSLNLGGCLKITDAAVVAVASSCTKLTRLDLHFCGNITDAAVVAVASKCPQLSSLDLMNCSEITDAAVVALALGCPHLTSLDLMNCISITNEAVVAVAFGCPQLSSLRLWNCHNISHEAVKAVASNCKQLTSLNLTNCHHITNTTRSLVPRNVRLLPPLPRGFRVYSEPAGQRGEQTPVSPSMASKIRECEPLQRGRQRDGGGGCLGLPAVLVARPGWLRRHHQRGGGDDSLPVQATHDVRPDLQDHRRSGNNGASPAHEAQRELLLHSHRRGGGGGGLGKAWSTS